MDDEVIDDQLWARMDVGSLLDILNALLAQGDVTRDTLVVVDSDPEGNGMHPIRQAFGLGTLEFGRSGQIEDFNDSDDKPAATMWLGVGY